MEPTDIEHGVFRTEPGIRDDLDARPLARFVWQFRHLIQRAHSGPGPSAILRLSAGSRSDLCPVSSPLEREAVDGVTRKNVR